MTGGGVMVVSTRHSAEADGAASSNPAAANGPSAMLIADLRLAPTPVRAHDNWPRETHTRVPTTLECMALRSGLGCLYGGSD